MSRFLAVFLSLLFCSAFATRFIFSVRFDCTYHYRESYNYMVKFQEYDTLFSNDEITAQYFGKARPGISRFDVEGTQSSDQIFSAGYEPYVEVWHDCTEYKKQVFLTIFFTPLCPIDQKICHYRIHADLTDRWGEETMHVNITDNELPFDD